MKKLEVPLNWRVRAESMLSITKSGRLWRGSSARGRALGGWHCSRLCCHLQGAVPHCPVSGSSMDVPAAFSSCQAQPELLPAALRTLGGVREPEEEHPHPSTIPFSSSFNPEKRGSSSSQLHPDLGAGTCCRMAFGSADPYS